MINVNGKSFSNVKDAIAYLEKEEKKATKREKELEDFLKKNLNFVTANFKDKVYIFCTIGPDEKNKALYPTVGLNTILGSQYFINTYGEIIQNYELSKVQDANSELGKKIINFLKDKIAPSTSYKRWDNVSLYEKNDAVLIYINYMEYYPSYLEKVIERLFE